MHKVYLEHTGLLNGLLAKVDSSICFELTYNPDCAMRFESIPAANDFIYKNNLQDKFVLYIDPILDLDDNKLYKDTQ
jgi:hypothetical protein